mmetsp:Transcript_19456/g.28837  ORF Transcript_19456/g.28837 Transcript_19456/m.28837 type:complete len:265 (-) Transcript_19456:383-1177(-)
MSANNNNASYTQAKNVERRTWDKEVWEAKAKARQEQEKKLGGNNKNVGPVIPQKGENNKKRALLLGDDDDEKEEFQPATAGAVGPEKSERAFVKARRNKVDIDSKIGSTEVISADAAAANDISEGVTKTGVGWHCKVCDCFLKDSHTYLDHINGRKHQRNLGYSMRVERSTKEQVNERLKQLLVDQQQQQKSSSIPEDLLMGASDMIKKKDTDLKRQKEERIKRRKERKEAAKRQEEDDDEPQIDPAMAAMMGFSGFGGGNKNR